MLNKTRPLGRILITALLLAAAAGTARAQNLEVEELILDNGMKFLFVQRPGEPMVVGGWVAKVGSVNERPGITGISHLFEHMMFKGSTRIGTKDHAAEQATIDELDAVRARVRAEELALIESERRGEIADAKDPAARTDNHAALLKRLAELEEATREFVIKDEFDRIYTREGAQAMNAGTSYDYTIYFIQVPPNKLELWFWMESERLLNPVFREFYSERDVVHEERRMRTDSTPTGRFQEQFEAMFWQSSPYSWPVIGWPSDLEGITREEALDYYGVNYAPGNLTACIVGDIDTAEAKKLAARYFGRLRPGAHPQPPVRTLEMEQLAEKRMIAYAETNPSVTIRYQGVADGHADEPALVLLGKLLSGRTGRLHKSLVLDRKIATSASAYQAGMRFEGYFSFQAEAREGFTPEDLEAALNEEIARLKSEPVTERELQKVKNQELVSRYRNFEGSFPLMIELLIRDTLREWRTINTDAPLYQGVTVEDVQRVANTYFVRERSTVGVYYRKETAAAPDEKAL